MAVAGWLERRSRNFRREPEIEMKTITVCICVSDEYAGRSTLLLLIPASLPTLRASWGPLAAAAD